jgi:diguanylate cyclase (GGDEF)-like protein/PAS domain S-box-containing protein
MSELQHPEIFRTVLETLQVGVYLVDCDGKILFWNDGAERITGYLRQDVVGRFGRGNILMHCEQPGCVLCGTVCPLTETMHDGQPREAQVYLRHRAGHRVPVHVRAVAIRDCHGVIIGAAESFDDVGFIPDPDRRQDELAVHGCLDATTGIPNHGFTQTHLREHFATFVEYELPFGVLCIQVDELDHLRETHGHPAADAMLRVVAHTLQKTLRLTDSLGRWSDDQFLAIVPNCNPATLEEVGARVCTIVSCSGIEWWGDPLSVTVSLGSAAVQAGDTPESLVERAQHSFHRGPCEKAVEPRPLMPRNCVHSED